MKKENENIFNKSGKVNEAKLKNIAKNYKRIGTKYFLYSTKLTAKKRPVKILKLWTKAAIKEDHGNTIFKHILKYFDFVLVPDNTINYKREIGNCYNLYEPIQYKPQKGEFPLTQIFLNHIFGEYYKIGIDYLTILYSKPAEKLPALCLVSKEQKTGKSTFLHWLNNIYGDNAIILGNEDFNSNFNISWAQKLIIGIDESFIEKKVIKEKIKRLITDDQVLTELKGIDKTRENFIGKFILNSNNEDNFIQMEDEDNRFFVLKIPKVKNEDPNLEDKLIKEIPAFLHFLANRQLNYKKESRLWFKPELYSTDALKKVVKNSRTIIEKTLLDYLTDMIDNLKAIEEYQELTTLEIVPIRIAEAIKPIIGNYKGLHIEITKILESWGLKPEQQPKRFSYFVWDETNLEGVVERIVRTKKQTGRFYTIPFILIDKLNE